VAGVSTNDVDRLLTAWLATDAGGGEPEGLIDRVLERTARTRRRPGWLIRERWIPMQLTMRWQPVPRAVPVLVMLALLVAAALVVLAVGGRKPLPPPFGPADNGRIAYVSNGQLWTIEPNGSDPRAISTGPGIKGLPMWSRDGTKIAYLVYGDAYSRTTASLFIADADGSHARALASNEEALRYASWSPTGQSIAFSHWITYPGQRDRIFVATLAGSDQARQVGDPDMSAYDPAFSPDGARILFRSDLNETGFALQIMKADGSGILRLSGTVVAIGWEDEYGTRGFDWSHDGTRILFSGNESGDPHVPNDLYVVKPDGVNPPQRITGGESTEYAATWSPTGDRILYLRELEHVVEAVVMNSDGTNARVVARDIAPISPQWSPDGRFVIVYRGGSGADRDLSIVWADGSGVSTDIHLKLPPTASSLSDVPGFDAFAWQRR
jgi:Tol biopolymer transport system component